MNINRNNYEAFFLLYVDKELSAADNKAVELFVQQNPDLGEELQMLQQTIIPAENIAFDNKSLLLKEESITALQENLLLLADDELPAADKKDLLKKIAADADIAAEWKTIQQTKLQADATIGFLDKASLYRKENEPAKVVGIRWWRVAIAALLIGFSLWGGIALYTSNSSTTGGGNELANDGKTKKNDKQPAVATPANNSNTIAGLNDISKQPAEQNSVQPANNTPTNTAGINNSDGGLATNTTSKKKITNPVDNKKNSNNSNTNGNENPEPVQKEVMAKLKPQETNNLPTPLYNIINNSSSNKTATATVTPTVTNSGKPDNGLALAENRNPQMGTNPIAKTAAFTEGEDGNYINTDNKKRSKFGGFLRKVTRVISRATNGSEGDGKTVKIAGFDIAVN